MGAEAIPLRKVLVPLLALLPLSLLAEQRGAPELLVFLLAGAGIIPFALLLSQATEAIAELPRPWRGMVSSRPTSP